MGLEISSAFSLDMFVSTDLKIGAQFSDPDAFVLAVDLKSGR